MPHVTSLENVLAHIRTVVSMLQEVAQATQSPLLLTVFRISSLVIETMQNVKGNKERWLRVLEKVHDLLCALVTLSSTRELDTLPPSTMDAVGRFAENLQKIQSCMRSQKELGTIKRFFKQTEILEQLNSCEAELKTILDVFNVACGVGVSSAIQEVEMGAERRHQELLALMDAGSIRSGSDIASSIHLSHRQHSNSSSIFSMLPPSPQIFHGRETELQEICATLLGNCPHVAIVGPGGIGKTALATAALHNPAIVAKYAHRYFVACEGANSAKDVIAIVGGHLDLEPSRTLSKEIYHYLLAHGDCIMVLDNLETAWEPAASRAEVERFLSILTDVPHVALLVTMRGAERPEMVKWSRPFLSSLTPLELIAARDIFVDIVDAPAGPQEEAALAGLLEATGYLPLAISLMARVASFEGYSAALSRWEAESTALISDGFDKRSSLEKSILVSLSSPRLSSTSHARDLLRLLCILPDGISDADLVQSGVPIPDILLAKSLLLRTSLAYLDQDRRLKVLAPIREYIHAAFPPSRDLVITMREYLCGFLRIWDERRQLSSNHLIPQLTANLGNLHRMLKEGVTATDSEDLKQTIRMILVLDRFTVVTARGETGLIPLLPAVLDQVSDDALRGQYLRSRFSSYVGSISPGDVEQLSNQGIQCFKNAGDKSGEAAFYISLGRYHFQTGDTRTALRFTELGLKLAKEIGDIAQQYAAIFGLGFLHTRSNNPAKVLEYCQEGQRIGRLRGDFPAEAECIGQEAMSLLRSANLGRALALCHTGRELLRACGSQGGQHELFLISVQADIHFRRTEYLEAQKLQTLITTLSSDTKAPIPHAAALGNLAEIDIVLGADGHQIMQKIDAVRKISTNHFWSYGLRLCDHAMGDLHLRRGEIAEARTLYEKGLAETGSDDITLMCLEKLADPGTQMYADETFSRAIVYFSYAMKCQEMFAIHQALRYIGDIFHRKGDKGTAQGVFHTALSAFTEMGVLRGQADCLSRLGDICLQSGNAFEAKDFWMRARPLFDASFQMKEVTSIDDRLAQVADVDVVEATQS
ncbi:hypothetical protein C8R44DRAFT_977428 [Mycena epipterygia]|nr:hypothetical protein C8R44DRAFT_977428 [Mycena epipterygia]